MFSGQKGVNALNIFKWKWHIKSSLTTGLLDDVPPEIELSDYHRAPSPGSESPSGLLDCETLNIEPIEDLDLFFERIYCYYCEKGLRCIIVKWIVELLSVAFTIFFSAFFLLFVNWNGLRSAKCGMVAVESGIKPCDLAKEAFHRHPLTPFTLSKGVIVGYLGIISIYLIFCFLRFFAQLKETLKIRRFYCNSLRVTDTELETMPWKEILEKVVGVQSLQCVVKDLSIHYVVMRLMRKENYLIGMINKGVLAFPLSSWVPGAGPTAIVDSHGVRHHLMLPKTLEWTLNWCILQSMFDRNFRVRRDFVQNPETLKKRLMIVGFALLLLSPFLVIFMLVYLFLRHAEPFYHHPIKVFSRRWSNLSKWMFREFNEVDHLFKHRVNSSIVHASNYLKQFPSPILNIIAKFISFVSGGFTAVLIILALWEESLLEGHIFGRNLFWYSMVFGVITAVSRSLVKDELLVLDHQGTMSLVVQHTHHMPKRWRGKENTETVRLEFETLFQYTGMMLLEEMASIFLTPYLLLFVVPKRVDDILQFIVDFTVDVEGVGHVCSFSLFDFKNHGNRKYASPYDVSRDQRSCQGKMEKSFLSFMIAYPSWEPDADGKKLVALLQTFRDQKLHSHRTTNAHMPSIMQQQRSTDFRSFSDQNSFLSREETPFNYLRNFQQSDSMWLIDPYILHWYYTSQNHDRDERFRELPVSRHYDNDEENPEDTWNPPSFPKNNTWNLPSFTKNKANSENWENLLEIRVESNLEASTSAPFFQESVLQHHDDSNNAMHGARSHWWARTQPQGPDAQTSFLEPPTFYREPSREYYENLSERSLEEDEQGPQLDLRNSKGLSRTFYMDDLGGGDFDLPFVDVYTSP